MAKKEQKFNPPLKNPKAGKSFAGGGRMIDLPGLFDETYGVNVKKNICQMYWELCAEESG